MHKRGVKSQKIKLFNKSTYATRGGQLTVREEDMKRTDQKGTNRVKSTVIGVMGGGRR